MRDVDYAKLGLKAGLEIHQQLDTNKLFCNCPSDIREDAPDKTIKRVLRASAGETGSVDIAAAYEMSKQKHYVYEYYNDTICDVELDECPPFNINPEALKIVLQLSKMMNAETVNQVHVMRKTVVDGSNTSGFQRTALIARNGFIEVESDEKLNRIKIDTLCLEEDAARIISRDQDHDIYRLDRLGIPLIEIATGPDMRTAKQVKDIAGFIGMMLRSTGKVKRGLGTIRQDVNVSIAEGARTEIKGVQDLRMIDTVVELEVLRQLTMLKLRDEIRARIKKLDLSNEIIDLTEYFSDTKSSMIKKNVDSRVYGKFYKDFKGFFGFEVNPSRRFGSELSDRIKAFGLNGLIHTDEDLNKYKIADEVKKIYDALNLDDSDSLIMIIGTEEKCKFAFNKIDETIKSFYDKGLSKEVRNAREDGTSSFLRPMPGSSRMYPETDVKTIIPDLSEIEMPELIKDKVVRFEKKYSLPAQVAKELVFENDFEIFVKKYPQVKPVTIAEILVSTPKEVKTRFNLEIDVELERFRELADNILAKLNSGDLAKEAIIEIMVEYAKGNTIDFSIYKTNEEELISFIVNLISKHPNLNSAALMGETMKKYRGKFPGSRIMELVKKYKGE
ncbi:TPA: Glu-tRNA(Gln) amidotransferase subunit GatE [Candidatus Woesearchaeota archaeon]|nr:Glu-tRNA(Gln) amidotransferase subunit GatE [Candidatus Woesearchaeota archaeon]HIH31900.1 Glu-tRNA(Gln) amidotransferase subunit GatE [Candidatus Woesearchaeota archaeon]HIH54349.1 Glu-tRNA(Gln) amidotransferase subunit GatE [Candidatus Woesearchaeota archaeon]HIJ02175.1 Glu-tRNA(Gln) amidotransferase subunit GatE [Candidatus Woesearchaeota archaeon]HIJ13192.1 Glu-tRNA(Gln) amidotransferase subunit GatE [Candidatus Woesearchaeota archaeon]